MDLLSLIYLTIIVIISNVCYVSAGEACLENGATVYCEYGCCGTGPDTKCCAISTSVLIVACVVSGLVLIALVCAIVICCWKSYRDKQASRVRRLRHEEAMNAPRVPGVEPPKPPSYVSAPPDYSEDMPESHFRPPTVSGHISYNQRFRGTTPVSRAPAEGNVHVTSTSGRNPVIYSYSLRNTHIPGAVDSEAPPPYSEFARGHTPANRRHRRFIRSPVQEANEEASMQTQNPGATSVTTPVVVSSGLESHVGQSRAQETSQRGTESRTIESAVSRVQESRGDSSLDNGSRAQTVARVLGSHSLISRIPTRVHGMQSRHLSSVQSRASTRPNQASRASTSQSSVTNGTLSVQEEEVPHLAVI